MAMQLNSSPEFPFIMVQFEEFLALLVFIYFGRDSLVSLWIAVQGGVNNFFFFLCCYLMGAVNSLIYLISSTSREFLPMTSG